MLLVTQGFSVEADSCVDLVINSLEDIPYLLGGEQVLFRKGAAPAVPTNTAGAREIALQPGTGFLNIPEVYLQHFTGGQQHGKAGGLIRPEVPSAQDSGMGLPSLDAW